MAASETSIDTKTSEPVGVQRRPAAGPWATAFRKLVRDKAAMAALLLFVLIVIGCCLAPYYANSIAHTEPFSSNLDGTVMIDGEEQLGCGAFAFRPDDQALRDQFNDVLVEMKANDEILPIIEPFGFTSAEVDAAKDVTVGDLAGEG